MNETATPAIDFTESEEQMRERQGLAIYMNISTSKLHTSAGIVWPRQEFVLPTSEAKQWGDKIVRRS